MVSKPFFVATPCTESRVQVQIDLTFFYLELEAKIADLGFSAKVYFLYNFLFHKNKYFSRNLDWNLDTFVLNKQKWIRVANS